MTDLYKTIQSPCSGEYRDRGSKFLAFGFPVVSEEEAKNIVAELKKKYHDARHHCFAYNIGAEGLYRRVNDDGEPSGTAGKPIYGQILSAGLSDILIVVIRYFGGTLLGTGGLIRAYRTASENALNNAVVVEKTVDDTVELTFGYEFMNEIKKILKKYGCRLENQQFDEMCHFWIRIRTSNTVPFIQHISGLKDAKVVVHKHA